MKKHLLFAFFFLVGTSLMAQNQESKNTSSLSLAEQKKFTLDVGFSMLFLSTNNDVEAFGGFVFGGGYYISPKNLLGFELSFMFGGGDDIGSFSYYYNDSPGRLHTDGEITRDYTAIPVLGYWNYIFDITEKFHLRLGPSLGFTVLNAYNSYNPSNIEGLPGSHSRNTTMFTFGAGIGASWDILKSCSLTVGYKFIINSGSSFESMDINPIANQINITWGWRF